MNPPTHPPTHPPTSPGLIFDVHLSGGAETHRFCSSSKHARTAFVKG